MTSSVSPLPMNFINHNSGPTLDTMVAGNLGRDGSRHIRSDDGKQIYVNKGKVTKGFWQDRFSFRSAQRRRADGASAVHRALVNQLGSVSLANSVMENVAKSGGRTRSQMMQAGVSVTELRAMQVEMRRLTRPAAERAQQVSQAAGDLRDTMAEWDRGQFGRHERLNKAGQAFVQLDNDQQNFVRMRLRSMVRDAAQGGEPLSPKETGKTALMLIGEAKSEHFGALKAKWRDIGIATRGLSGMLRIARPKDTQHLVRSAMNWSQQFSDLGTYEDKARGTYAADKSEWDKIDNYYSNEEKNEAGAQAFDDHMGGVSIAEAAGGYHKAMGPKGPARAALFAAAMHNCIQAEDLSYNDEEQTGARVLSEVEKGLETAVGALAAKGQVAGFAEERAAIAEVFRAAAFELAPLTDAETAKIAQDAEKRVTDTVGKHHPRFADKVADQVRYGTARLKNRKAQPLLAAFAKAPNSATGKTVMSTAMKLAGIKDRAAVMKAFNEIDAEVTRRMDLLAQQKPIAPAPANEQNRGHSESIVSV